MVFTTEGYFRFSEVAIESWPDKYIYIYIYIYIYMYIYIYIYIYIYHIINRPTHSHCFLIEFFC